jgi:hypothetical protein
MFRGRFQQGEFVPLGVACINAAGAPVAPDAAPTLNVYGPSGTKLLAAKPIPTMDRFGTTGLFAFGLFLNETFPAGHYAVAYQWASGAFAGGELDCFEVKAGGDPKGSLISLYWFEQPQAGHVIQELDSGRLTVGSGPYL